MGKITLSLMMIRKMMRREESRSINMSEHEEMEKWKRIGTIREMKRRASNNYSSRYC